MASLSVLYDAYENALVNGWAGVTKFRRADQDGTTFLNFRAGSADIDLSIVSMDVDLPTLADDGAGPWLIRLFSQLVLTRPTPDVYSFVARRNASLPLCSLSVVDSEIEELVAIRLQAMYWDTDRPVVDLRRNFEIFLLLADELDDEILSVLGGLRYSELVDGGEPRFYEPTAAG